MTIRIKADELPDYARDFVAARKVSYGAVGGAGGGLTLAGLVDATNAHVDGVPPQVALALMRAAVKAGAESVFEIEPPTPPRTEPSRRDFPDTVEGHSRYMRALGEFKAATRKPFE